MSSRQGTAIDQPVTFGEWLRQRRDQLRFTRREFSDRVGCSVSALRKFESDERRPSLQIAELIANCLEIPPAERRTFLQVARGELAVDRLQTESKQPARPGLASTQAGATPGSSLPVFPTPLVGRTREVEELSLLLRDPGCRLLSLVGPGGIGKTRLAIATATQVQDDFAGGVCFGPFDDVPSSRLVIPLMAHSVGLAFRADIPADPKEQLLNYLGSKHILLLADNLEQLLYDPTVAELLAELLDRAPQTKLLVTSREPLGLQGEWVFEVQGLSIPEGEDPEGTSVELFLQRARRANVRFNPTTDDYPAILDICHLVGGNPLGLELAAAWVRSLSCREIAREIERGLNFLSVSARDLPARHRSMRAVFDHSWRLLTEEEQRTLLRLSVFHGGFQRAAAEAVAGASLPTLSALVTKSLVRRTGTGRYDLHEVILQFALERLSTQDRERSRAAARHGAYYMSFLAHEEERLRSSAQQEALAEVTAEIDNIRSAQEWALASGQFSLIEGSMRAYGSFCDTLGWAQEALDYLDRVRAALESASRQAPPSRADQIALAHALTARSLFAFRVGQHEQARAMLDRSLQLLHSLDEPRVLVEALAFLGIISIIMGDLARALELFNEGLQTSTAIGDQWFAALCFTEQVSVHVMMGRSEGALERFRTAVEAWRATGDPRFTAFGLNFLSWSAIAAGRYEEAHRALEESIALYGSIGDRWGLSSAYRGLGLVSQAQGSHGQAVELFHKSMGLFTELGARWDTGRVLADMGRSLVALGDDEGSERAWREAIRLAMETKGTLVALEAIVGMAGLKAKGGAPFVALQWLLMVLHHQATIQETKVRAMELASELEMKLTPGEIEAAHVQAGDRTLESVVEAILQKDGGV